MPPRLVLLHGAYHGPEIWDPLRRRLLDAGVETYAPPVSHEDPAALIGELAGIKSSYCLVAHSLAGSLASDLLADPGTSRRIEALAFLAAYLPRKGESAAGLARLDRGAGVHERVRPAHTEGMVELDAEAARELFFGGKEGSEAVEEALRGLRPQSRESFRRRASRDLPGDPQAPRRAYIVCRRDRAITPALQRRMAADALCQPVLELDSVHMPMVTDSDGLARMLLTLWPELLRAR